MNKLAWYYYRIKRIPIAEYPYRFILTGKKIHDRFTKKPKKRQTPVSYQETRLKISTLDIADIFSEKKNEIINHADDILNHNFNIFGIVRNFGDPINWSLDPKTGNTWPLEFWGKIKYRDGKTIGGIKFAWELNRLHHLPQLALVFSLTGNPKYKEEIFTQLKSWIKSNPYPKGINWIMGIELGIRITNVVYTLKFLGEAQLKPEQQKLISQFIFIHANHLYRYPSKHTSGGNHAISEALGLFITGLCFPKMRKAHKWKRFGKNVLEREIVRQIYPDGSSFEHSIPYLQFIVDHYLIYYLLCKQHNEAYDPVIEKRLKASFEFIHSILDENANYPSIGDNDDGHLLKIWFGTHNNFSSLLNTGAILFNRPEWLRDKSKLDHKTQLLLGKSAQNILNQKKAGLTTNLPDTKFFKHSGLAVIRDNTHPKVLFIGNSGPLGLRPLAGHGHADALSFWISVDGKPIFIDPGNYLYHSGSEWRNYFRSTSAHNTITVDKNDQAKMVADFIFSNFYKIKDPLLKENPESILWSAGHDGYKKINDPVSHIRTVKYLKKKRQFIIKDELKCTGKHWIECFFHFYPACSVKTKNNIYYIFCGDIKVQLEIDKNWINQKLLIGNYNPLSGWFSAGFNQLVETNTLLLSTKIEGQKSFFSVIDISN